MKTTQIAIPTISSVRLDSLVNSISNNASQINPSTSIGVSNQFSN